MRSLALSMLFVALTISLFFPSAAAQCAPSECVEASIQYADSANEAATRAALNGYGIAVATVNESYGLGLYAAGCGYAIPSTPPYFPTIGACFDGLLYGSFFLADGLIVRAFDWSDVTYRDVAVPTNEYWAALLS